MVPEALDLANRLGPGPAVGWKPRARPADDVSGRINDSASTVVVENEDSNVRELDGDSLEIL